MREPLAYFLTFTCYGQWLPGDSRGSVDPGHNAWKSSFVAASQLRRNAALRSMLQPAYQLDEAQRAVVLGAIREVCEQRGWTLWTAHVRWNHIHAIVTAADIRPERVMSDFKAYASRRLTELDPALRDRQRWTRHGSTRRIFDEQHLDRAMNYVLHAQGAAQAVYDGRPQSRARQ